MYSPRNKLLRGVLKIVLYVILSLSITSCAYWQRYPRNWDIPPNKSQECSNVSGTFLDIGENAYGRRTRLSQLLFPPPNWLFDSVSHIHVEKQSEDVLKIVVSSRQNVEEEITYYRSNHDFDCDAGWIRITKPARRTSDKFVLGTTSGTISLTKSDDGNLIVQDRSSNVGLGCLVIPLFQINRHWYRFNRAAEEIKKENL